MNFFRNLNPLIRQTVNENTNSTANYALLQALGDALTETEKVAIEAKIESSLSTAEGVYLDEWGSWFGVARKTDQDDDSYRQWIHDYVLLKRGTINAIIHAIKVYLDMQDANISIYEPYRNMFQLDHSYLDGEDHLEGNYYRYAIITVNIDRPVDPKIYNIIQMFKPAGVKFYVSVNIDGDAEGTILHPISLSVDSEMVIDRMFGNWAEISADLDTSYTNDITKLENLFTTDKSLTDGPDVLGGSPNINRELWSFAVESDTALSKANVPASFDNSAILKLGTQLDDSFIANLGRRIPANATVTTTKKLIYLSVNIKNTLESKYSTLLKEIATGGYDNAYKELLVNGKLTLGYTPQKSSQSFSVSLWDFKDNKLATLKNKATVANPEMFVSNTGYMLIEIAMNAAGTLSLKNLYLNFKQIVKDESTIGIVYNTDWFDTADNMEDGVSTILETNQYRAYSTSPDGTSDFQVDTVMPTNLYATTKAETGKLDDKGTVVASDAGTDMYTSNFIAVDATKDYTLLDEVTVPANKSPYYAVSCYDGSKKFLKLMEYNTSSTSQDVTSVKEYHDFGPSAEYGSLPTDTHFVRIAVATYSDGLVSFYQNLYYTGEATDHQEYYASPDDGDYTGIKTLYGGTNLLVGTTDTVQTKNAVTGWGVVDGADAHFTNFDKTKNYTYSVKLTNSPVDGHTEVYVHNNDTTLKVISGTFVAKGKTDYSVVILTPEDLANASYLEFHVHAYSSSLKESYDIQWSEEKLEEGTKRTEYNANPVSLKPSDFMWASKDAWSSSKDGSADFTTSRRNFLQDSQFKNNHWIAEQGPCADQANVSISPDQITLTGTQSASTNTWQGTSFYSNGDATSLNALQPGMPVNISTEYALDSWSSGDISVTLSYQYKDGSAPVVVATAKPTNTNITGWTTISGSGMVPHDLDVSKLRYWRVQYQTTGNSTVRFRHPKVEIGKGATPWVIAQEDMGSTKRNYEGEIRNTFDQRIYKLSGTALYHNWSPYNDTLAGTKITPNNLPNLAKTSLLSIYSDSYLFGNTKKLTMRQVNATGNAGIWINSDSFLKVNTKYVFSFDFKLTSGSIARIGGHTGMFDYNSILTYINGVLSSGRNWADGVNLKLNTGQSAHFDVVLTSLPDFSKGMLPNGFFIQPRQDGAWPKYVAEVSNIQVTEGGINDTWNYASGDNDSTSTVSPTQRDNLFSVQHYSDQYYPSTQYPDTIDQVAIKLAENTSYSVSTDVPVRDDGADDIFAWSNVPGAHQPGSVANGIAKSKPRMVTTSDDGILYVAIRNYHHQIINGDNHIKIEKGYGSTTWSPCANDADGVMINPNLLFNSDFKTNTDNWHAYGDQSVAVDTTNKVNGYNSLLITSSAAGGPQSNYVKTPIIESDYYTPDNTKMTLSFYAKTTDTSKSALLGYCLSNHDTETSNSGANQFQVTADWNTFQVTLPWTASLSYDDLKLWVVNAGSVIINSVKLELGTEDTDYVPAIQGDGVNLLHNSGTFDTTEVTWHNNSITHFGRARDAQWGYYYTPNAWYSMDYSWKQIVDDGDYSTDQWYVFSVQIKNTSKTDAFVNFYSATPPELKSDSFQAVSPNGACASLIKAGSDWQTLQVALKPTLDITKVTNEETFRFETTNTVTDGSILIGAPMLEKGMVASKWVPNTSDNKDLLTGHADDVLVEPYQLVKEKVTPWLSYGLYTGTDESYDGGYTVAHFKWNAGDKTYIVQGLTEGTTTGFFQSVDYPAFIIPFDINCSYNLLNDPSFTDPATYGYQTNGVSDTTDGGSNTYCTFKDGIVTITDPYTDSSFKQYQFVDDHQNKWPGTFGSNLKAGDSILLSYEYYIPKAFTTTTTYAIESDLRYNPASGDAVYIGRVDVGTDAVIGTWTTVSGVAKVPDNFTQSAVSFWRFVIGSTIPGTVQVRNPRLEVIHRATLSSTADDSTVTINTFPANPTPSSGRSFKITKGYTWQKATDFQASKKDYTKVTVAYKDSESTDKGAYFLGDVPLDSVTYAGTTIYNRNRATEIDLGRGYISASNGTVVSSKWTNGTNEQYQKTLVSAQAGLQYTLSTDTMYPVSGQRGTSLAFYDINGNFLAMTASDSSSLSTYVAVPDTGYVTLETNFTATAPSKTAFMVASWRSYVQTDAKLYEGTYNTYADNRPFDAGWTTTGSVSSAGTDVVPFTDSPEDILAYAPNLVPDTEDMVTTSTAKGDKNVVLKPHAYFTKYGNLYAINNSTQNETYAHSSDFTLEPDTTYTLSFTAFAGKDVTSMDVFLLNTDAKTYGTFGAANVAAIVDGLVPSSDQATTYSYTFKTNPKDKLGTVNLRIDNNGGSNANSCLYFGQVQIVKGTQAMPYEESLANIAKATSTNVLPDSVLDAKATNWRTSGSVSGSTRKVVTVSDFPGEANGFQFADDVGTAGQSLMARDAIAIEAGTPYTISVWYKTSIGNTRAGQQFSIKQNAGAPWTHQVFETIPDNQWHQITYWVNTLDGAKYASYYVGLVDVVSKDKSDITMTGFTITKGFHAPASFPTGGG